VKQQSGSKQLPRNLLANDDSSETNELFCSAVSGWSLFSTMLNFCVHAFLMYRLSGDVVDAS
jgi:hypothetical protein